MIYSATSIFLNSDIKSPLTGIEHAALLRATLFEKKTGLPPIIATLELNSFNEYYVQQHKNSGRYSNQLNIINVWDELLNYNQYDKLDNENEAIGLVIEENIKEENLLIKKEFFRDTRKTRQIDFYDGQVKRKSQAFHFDGYKCCEKIFNNKGEHTHSIYYAPNGSPLLLKITSNFKNKTALQAGFYFFINNKIKYLGDKNYLLALALVLIIKKQRTQNTVLITDRNNEEYKVAVIARDLLAKEGKRIYLIAQFHSTHYRGFNKNDQISIHYKNVLDQKQKSADSLVCLTKKQQADMQARFPDQSIHCIPHTFNKNLVPKHGETQPIVVYIARLAPEKNHIAAIEIFAQVLKAIPNASLHIYGIGSEARAIHSKIQELNLNNHVFLKGHLDSVSPIYQSASLSISTSKAEGFGLSILESMACGCPSVAYDVDYGPSDIIDSGINGYLIKLDDKDNFSNKVISILKNPELRNKLARQARASAINKFGEDNIFALWADLYQTLTTDLPIKVNS